RQYYDLSIQCAAQNQMTYVEAIANENAALLCQERQLVQDTQNYVKKSWEAYKKWGATIKCNQLESTYPGLLGKKTDKTALLKTGATYETYFSSNTALDLASLLKASQSIASQVKYKDLLKTLMHIIIENAGAEKGNFLRFKKDRLYIEVQGNSGNKGIKILPSIPMNESDLVPRSFINYCWRSQESVVLDDAQKESRFNDDPYIKKHKTVSIMCLPITALGKINGLLYLENSMLKGVFDKNRISLLQMLSGQIGISIENALLYENLEEKVAERTKEIEKTLTELKTTQAQLIQSEKMASLGELTAGIAHEIQNPLNFVNNFSEVSGELLDEMEQEIAQGNYADAKGIARDVRQNLEKINLHGKRADAIIKGMLQHSRTNSNIKEPTDINAIADEYLRLAYHGLRAKNKSFNATMETDFDESIGKINMVPQDIGRVLLNLITNAFHAVQEKREATIGDTGSNYQPSVRVATKRIEDHIEISVHDNGNGVPEKVRGKIFQPFFTTKPSGKGTGLGLSLSYEIIQTHGGELGLETQEGEGATFTIRLPAI
ncbi:sensor histidine kinase, partial [Pricia sp.]|uniref:sensor histidine kinase n=1 Tax=Pricia sp. TaxID=2268138 RepID=UPI003593239F